MEQQDPGWVIPAQEPAGDVYEQAGGPVTRLYGTQLGSSYLQDPLIGIADSLPADLAWLRDLLRPWLAVLISLSLFLAANAVVGGSARVIYSLARHSQVPAALGRVDPARMTPYVGIALFGVGAAVLLLPRDPVLLLGLFGFGASLAFTMAQRLGRRASATANRTLSRPFVVPFSVRYRGALLPLPAVIGAAATALIWVFMVATHPEGRLLGFAWLAAGVLLYVVHRRRARLPLGRQPQQTRLPSAALVDVDYERILVPVDGTRLTDEMMVLGCQLAADKNATIDVVYVVEVPMNLALDAGMPDERARGRRVLDAALAVARDFGVEAWPHLVASRTVGRAVVETAQEWNADVIILGAVRKRRLDDRVLGDSTQYVLRHAPGEVLLNFVPEDYPMQGSAAETDAETGRHGPGTPRRLRAPRGSDGGDVRHHRGMRTSRLARGAAARRRGPRRRRHRRGPRVVPTARRRLPRPVRRRRGDQLGDAARRGHRRRRRVRGGHRRRQHQHRLRAHRVARVRGALLGRARLRPRPGARLRQAGPAHGVPHRRGRDDDARR